MGSERPIRDELSEWQERHLDDFCYAVRQLALSPPARAIGGNPELVNRLMLMDVQCSGVEISPSGMAVTGDKPNRVRKIQRVLEETGLVNLRVEKRSAKRKAVVGDWPVVGQGAATVAGGHEMVG